MNIDTINYITKNFDTPAYLFDIDELQRRALFIKRNIGNKINICYAMKANSFIVKSLSEIADRFEVCSPGEFCICESEKLPPSKLVISGVYKQESDILRMIKTYDNIGFFTVESMQQLILLNKYATEYGKTINLLLRLTSGNQFGMDTTQIEEIISNRKSYTNINIVGLQYYSTTQKVSIKRIAKELDMLDNFLTLLKQTYGFIAKELEYGPGLPVMYFNNDKFIDETVFLNEIASLLAQMDYKGIISLEIGRFLTASCGIYMTKVVDTKVNKCENYCIVDGGIHHISYFGQMMAMKVPCFKHLPINKSGETLLWNICGSLCTVNDILIKQLPLCNLEIGDFLIFENTGAYCVMEGISLFLSRDLPMVFLYSEKDGLIVTRKKTQTFKLNSNLK